MRSSTCRMGIVGRMGGGATAAGRKRYRRISKDAAEKQIAEMNGGRKKDEMMKAVGDREGGEERRGEREGRDESGLTSTIYSKQNTFLQR
jgi:hypothetical protein